MNCAKKMLRNLGRILDYVKQEALEDGLDDKLDDICKMNREQMNDIHQYIKDSLAVQHY